MDGRPLHWKWAVIVVIVGVDVGVSDGRGGGDGCVGGQIHMDSGGDEDVFLFRGINVVHFEGLSMCT